jgi:histidinol-phosphate aminotransferase
MDLSSIRPAIRQMAGYTPGEQPREDSVIKLNTNENPYPPSPAVIDAIHAVLTGERLRKYPDPIGNVFREAAARVLDVDPNGILIGNGSDDILTILTRAFVPEGGIVASMTPSYLLYRTLAEIQGARYETVPFNADWQMPSPWPIRDANITYITNPNSPTGTIIPSRILAEFVEQVRSPVVVDEAYADFADDNALSLARRGKAIVTRTLSKSYSLAGIRFGFAIASPDIVAQLVKVKDSYNCDVLSLAAATAAVLDQPYRLAVRAKILATRERMTKRLGELGFTITPSHANFVWCRRTDRPVKPIYEELKRRQILVRYMSYEGYGDGLRITVGTDAEVDRLFEELGHVV